MKDNQFPAKILTMFVLAALIVAGALILYDRPQAVSAKAWGFASFVPNAPVPFTAGYPIDTGYCLSDVDGANDNPGQKDLTRLCFDDVTYPDTFLIEWNWDERGTNGANTMDGTTFFDSDGDGNANFAMNVTTSGNPAQMATANLYTCSDSRPLKCTGGALVAGGFDFKTVCGVYQVQNDPFPNGSSAPWDTVGYCAIPKSAFGVDVNVLNTCSKTSESIESDESDCVALKGGGFISIIKNEYPAVGNSWLFEVRNYLTNALVKSATLIPETNYLDPDFSTARVRYSLAPTAYNVAETNPNSFGYTLVAAACKDESTPLGGATNPFTNMTLLSGHEIICEFTNAVPTAVELAEFSAAPQTNAVNLTWTTASEIEITGFNILRSTDGIDYGHKVNQDPIAAVNFGQLLGATYEFVDQTALFGATYYYRLEVLFADGSTDFSDQVYAVPAGYKLFMPITMK